MINRYSKSVDNTLEEFVPLPLEMMLKAGQAIQQRGDLAEQQRDQTEVGLGSIETRAAGHKDFINKFVNDFRTESAAALEKVGMNTSNPEFIREMNKIKLKYAADPRLQTIKIANEKLKMEEQIAAKLKAEGKLFIRPEFNGVDERGNLTDNVQGVEAVNTLDDWNKQFAIAHQSMQNDGKGHETNRGNLNRARQIIEHDIKTGGPSSSKLIQAYVQQGMNPQQAKAAVATQLESLVNSYGVVDKRDWNYDQLLLQRQRYAQEDVYRKAALAQKAQKNGKSEDAVITPTFSRYNAPQTATKTAGDHSVWAAGESVNGTRDKAIKNQAISGKLYVIDHDKSSETYTPKNTKVDVNTGILKGYKNIYIDKKTGELVTSKGSLKMGQDANGNPVAFRNGKPFAVEMRTVAEYQINDGGKDRVSRTVYRVASRDEALREMGPGGAAYEGRNSVNIGRDFSPQFLQNFPENERKENQDALNRIIKGKGTPRDYQIADELKTILDYEYYTQPGGIYDEFKAQGKRANITGKPGTYEGPGEKEEDDINIDEE